MKWFLQMCSIDEMFFASLFSMLRLELLLVVACQKRYTRQSRPRPRLDGYVEVAHERGQGVDVVGGPAVPLIRVELPVKDVRSALEPSPGPSGLGWTISARESIVRHRRVP